MISSDRLEKLLILEDIDEDENILMLIAELRDYFLDSEKVSELLDYDISCETASSPHSVLYYIGVYIEYLENVIKKGEYCEKF